MSAPALTLHRARSAVPFASRGALAAALGWWREDAGNQDEWLLVPRLRLVAPSPALSSPTALARQFERALGAVREAATVDPAPGCWPPGALRFTRPERWLAWLAVRLATPAVNVPRECAPLPETPAVLASQLRETLSAEPRMLLAVIRILAAAGELSTWATGWSQADVNAICGALTVHFAVEPQDLVALQDETPKAVSSDMPQFLDLTETLLPKGRQSQSRSLAVARRTLSATALPPQSVRLDPQRQSLIHLLVAITRVPALASQLAQALALHQPAHSPDGYRVRRDAAQPSRILRQASKARPIRPASLPASLQTSGTKAAPLAARLALASPKGRNFPAQTAKSAKTLATPQMHRIVPAQRHDPAQANQPALFETRFGGMLFLFNAFTALGLYPDFTRPLGPRLDPSPCWLLGEIGKHWFGRRFGRDPLAGWLARRAIPGKLPGKWRLNPDWEPAFHRPLRFAWAGQACAWDRRGFLAAIAPLQPREHHFPAPPLKLVRKLRRLRVEPEPWLAGFLSYLGWRLAEAEVRRADLCLPAKLHWQDDSACLHLPLADLPIAVRLAGLDRDPGWLPAENCNFRFEFT